MPLFRRGNGTRGLLVLGTTPGRGCTRVFKWVEVLTKLLEVERWTEKEKGKASKKISLKIEWAFYVSPQPKLTGNAKKKGERGKRESSGII